MLDIEEYREIFSWDADKALSREEIERAFDKLDAFNQIIYDFLIQYNKYSYRERKYHSGVLLSMLEIHLLTDIARHPDLTSADLARKWDKTPSFISQVLRRLEDDGLIYRTQNKQDRKRQDLFLTPKGIEIDAYHREYDTRSIISTNKELLKRFSLEEIMTMRRVLEAYGNMIAEE